MSEEVWTVQDATELRRLQRKYKKCKRDKTRVRRFSPKKYKPTPTQLYHKRNKGVLTILLARYPSRQQPCVTVALEKTRIFCKTTNALHSKLGCVRHCSLQQIRIWQPLQISAGSKAIISSWDNVIFGLTFKCCILCFTSYVLVRPILA